MEKWYEFFMIVVTSVILVFMLYIFKGYIPSVNENKEGTGQNGTGNGKREALYMIPPKFQELSDLS